MNEMKKAQIMSMETIAVLLVFFIILVFVFMFYFSYRSSALEEKQQEFYSQQAVQIAMETANLPELECAGAGIEVGVDCFDKLKVQALSDLIKRSVELRAGIYLEKFGNSRIAIREIFRQGETDETEFVIYERVPENKKDEFVFQTMISLHDPTINHPIGIRSIGVLETTFYSTR
jgi:predicted permease